MGKQREGLGERFWSAITRVVRDNAPTWMQPALPGLAASPVEKSIQHGWTSYHAETDRLAAERLPKERPAPVTYRDQITKEGQAEARAFAGDLQWTAAQHPGDDFADKLLNDARDILGRNGMDEDGRPMARADRERWHRERGLDPN